jgi:hypothetical protein
MIIQRLKRSEAVTLLKKKDDFILKKGVTCEVYYAVKLVFLTAFTVIV